MRFLRNALVVLALAGVGLLIAPATPACACSCAEATLEEYRGYADVVFVGVVTKIDRPLFGLSSADPVGVTLQVSDVYQGRAQATTRVTTAMDGASCGYAFEEGRRYLVFAQAGQDGLSTGLCAGNRDLAREANPFTGGGGLPLPDPPSGWNPLWAVAAVVAAMATVAVLVWWLRRLAARRGPAADLGPAAGQKSA
jgi:hypothetical protein